MFQFWAIIERAEECVILVGVLQAKNLSLKNSVQAVANQKMIVPVKRSVQTAAN